MWIPLHVHSQFSVLHATPSVGQLVDAAEKQGLTALALTDLGNLHGAIDFYKACKAKKIKPLIGCELYIAPGSRHEKKKLSSKHKAGYPQVFIAKNEIGYRNLCQLSSLGYLEGFYYTPRIDCELLEKHHEGLICLSGGHGSEIAQALIQGEEKRARDTILWYQALFGEDFYLSIGRHQMAEEDLHFSESWLKQQYEEFIKEENLITARLIALHKELSIPLVATNESYYLEKEDWQAHEILLNIGSGDPVEIWEKDRNGNPTFRIPNPKRRTFSSREFYFKSPEQMVALFSDLPDAIATTVAISEKCHLSFDFTVKHYPVFLPPELREKSYTPQEQKEASARYLRTLCEEGILRRYGAAAEPKIFERLNYELEVIISKEMSDYLLIVWDFINWAKSRKIPVGPGRGSGAGSIVLYLLGITDIEPLRFHLFFERFINPERISYPDIDVDLCMARRSEVIDYMLKTYGKQNVAQIITFGTMKAKMAIKDVGRVLSIPLSKVNAIAKLIPEDLNITLKKALEVDVDLYTMYSEDADTKRLIDLAEKLEGAIRNTGIHAAGLIICGEPLTNHIPICLAKDSEMVATQYSMKPVESVGMLKIDFLGLKTLTSIDLALQAIFERWQVTIDWVNLPLDDKPTYELLQKGDTLGVFQMESGGMQELSKQLSPDHFEEIMAINALYRPGPMDMIPAFIQRKHGQEKIEYDHPMLEPILAETYGIMIYQEQVMHIAEKMAGYSLGEGDVLRKAMGKKDSEQMAKEREKFRQGAIKNQIEETQATAIFDKMEKFAAYGFNKSHAAAYGYLTYVTAYLKANYPMEWMAALMTCDRDDISKVAKFIRECKHQGIAILPPDINESGSGFLGTSAGIRFALTAIKGVGEGVVDLILEERKARGPFTSFYNFFERVDLSRVGKKTIDSLVAAGCFDYTGWSRDALTLSIEKMHAESLKEQKEKAGGVMTFFSMMPNVEEKKHLPPETLVKSSRHEILRREKELLGFFLTGHPMEEYHKILRRLSCYPLSDLSKLKEGDLVRVAFIIDSIKVRISTKNQKKFAILTISDGFESHELPIWSDLYEEKSELIAENQLLYAIVQVEAREENVRLQCRWLGDLTKIDEAMVQACDLAYDRIKLQQTQSAKYKKEKKKVMSSYQCKIDLTKVRLSHFLQLKALFRKYPGNSPVEIEFHQGERTLSKLFIPENAGITPSDALKKELEALVGSF